MTAAPPAWYVTSALESLTAHSERTALVYRGDTLPYGELLGAVHRSARAFARHGLRRGDSLVLVAGNRPEAFVVRYAAFLLGLRFTPVFPASAGGADGLRHIFADSQAIAVVFDPADNLGPVPEVAKNSGVSHVFSLGGAGHGIDLVAAAGAEPAQPLEVQARENDIARVLYTSGTTGLPKGVPSSYAALGASTRAWSSALAQDSGDGSAPENAESNLTMPEGMRFLLATPFSAGSGDAAFNILRFGGAVEILDGFDPADFVAALGRATMAVTYLFPSWLYRLLDHADAVGADLSPLKFVSYGSSPIAPARLRQALDRFGPNLMQAYATTEAPAIAMLNPADHAMALADRPELLGSVGRPLPSITVELHRPDGGEVPVGEVGEVCVRGASMMTGYWNRPDLTAAALRDGWLHTGDLGRFDAAGYLYLVGRLKDMIIVDGRNIYPGPVEDVLASHPAVREAAVVGVPDERTGEAIHAFVVIRRTGEPIDSDDLRTWAGARLIADAVPATVTLVDELPTTPVGKPDKKALRQRSTVAR